METLGVTVWAAGAAISTVTAKEANIHYSFNDTYTT